jgi:glutaconate CoA-transferase, subunit A
MPPPSKLVSMREAIAQNVRRGSVVLMGAQLEQMIPFAAGHEIIRQGIRDITLAGPISDILFDQLVGAGCVERILAAWVGNVSAGLGHCFRRAVEQSQPRAVQMVDYSNLTFALALHAGALGVPFLPTFSTLGTDLLDHNENLREFISPLANDKGDEKLVAVRALKPDVAILQVQRCDREGNSHVWGNLGVAIDGARAASRVIVIADEIVEPETISSDPNRTLIPGFIVSSVVHEPWGAHPSPVQGYCGRDHSFFSEYHDQTRTAAGFDAWLDRWVTRIPDRSAYLEQLGATRLAPLRVLEHAFTAPADFGY